MYAKSLIESHSDEGRRCLNAPAQSVLAKFRGGDLPTYSQRVENDGCSPSQSPRIRGVMP